MRPLLISILLLATAPAIATEPTPAPAAPASSAAAAAQSLDALDLRVPQSRSIYGNNAPGTWYGDHSLAKPQDQVDAEAIAQAQRGSRCPTSADGKPNPVTGSVAMGVGTASHYGTSTYVGADMNVCKDFVDDDGNHHLMNINISVDKLNGPHGGGYRGW